MKSLDERLKIIIITGYPTYESAIDAMKTGIFDYLSKSTDNDAILRKINAAVEERDRELAQKEDGAKSKFDIVLIGHHLLVREGLENFFRKTRNTACGTPTMRLTTSRKAILTSTRPCC